MQRMKNKLATFKARLTSASNNEPLNKFSLTTIIILDIIIFYILFVGLNDHTRQLTTEHEYMPPFAREVFILQLWTPDNRISHLEPLILAGCNNTRYCYKSPFDKNSVNRMHPAAQQLFKQVKTLSDDPVLHELFLKRQKKVDERNEVERAFEKAKQSYDTRLLENIANATRPGTNAPSIIAQQYAGKIDRFTEEICTLETAINNSSAIQTLWNFVSNGNVQRNQIVADYKRFQFCFPLKELIWQLLFLLPIFGIFYWWNGRSIKKDNPIQTLISSHLLIIASLPIIFKIVELVIDLIPKYFFKNLFDFLRSLHLMALWHYFLIFAIIAAGIALVYLIQRKVFSRQKVMQKRLMKGSCISCSKKLPLGAAFCPFCGSGQFEKCAACEKETPVGGTCCIHCGAPR